MENQGLVWGPARKGGNRFFSLLESTRVRQFLRESDAFLGCDVHFCPRVLRKEVLFKDMESKWRHSHQPTSLREKNKEAKNKIETKIEIVDGTTLPV